MANYRQIHTQIWRDNWFLDLQPDEKLLFIYLFSNDNSTLAGIYELHERIIALETGLDLQRIREIVTKFEQADKIHMADGVVWIVNMQKYHSNAGEKIQKNIDAVLADIPDCDIKHRYCITNGLIEKDTLSIPYAYPMDTLSYSKSNSNSNSIEKEKEKEEPGEKSFTAAGSQFGEISAIYQSEIGVLTAIVKDELQQAVKEYPPEWIGEALRESARQNKRSWKYAQAILKRWKVEGFKSQNKPAGNGHKTSQPSGADVNAFRALARKQGAV